MDQVLKLNEFFVEGGKQSLSHVLLHITEPSTQEEAKKGYFFALCEINNADASYITKLQDMIDRAENEYYEISEETGKDVFEFVLEKMNGEAYVLDSVREKLNCIIGAIRQKEIIFSYFGRPHLLLFFKNKQGLYERMDLIKSNAVDETDENLFSQIIQGKLSPNDYLFAGTPHITDFFSHDRLEKIITTRTAKLSAEHLDRVLGELKNGYSFGGMIINLFQPESVEVQKRSPSSVAGASTKSLNNLFNREQSTTATLSPSILPKLDKLKTILKTETTQVPGQKVKVDPLPAEINSVHVSHRPVRINSKDKISEILRIILDKGWWLIKTLFKYIASFFFVIYALIYGFIRFVILLFIALINYKNRRTTILEGWRLSWRGFWSNLVHLPLLTKVLFFGSILLAGAFVGSLFYIQYKQKIAAEEQLFSNTVRDLRQKKDNVESGIIYKNDSAFSEYKAAMAMMSELDCGSKEHAVICKELTTQFETLATKLRKVTVVQPSLLTDWGVSGPTGLIRLKNNLIGYSSSTSTLYSYDLLSQKTELLPTYPTISGFSEAVVPKENDYALFLYNKKLLMQLDPADLSQKLIDISFAGNAEIAGMIVYNRRLYSLDSLNSSLYRHDSIKTGFGQGKDWLKSRVDLKQGVDMAVDGDIFVSTNGGKILKLSAGIPASFQISGLDPALTSGAKLWTYTDIPYLYILDPVGKRLIIVEKNGFLVAQLTSPLFKNPIGLSIDYATKTAYILDSGKLYKISLP